MCVTDRHDMTLPVKVVLNSNASSTTAQSIADNKLNVTGMMIPVFDRIENIMGKGENAVKISRSN